MALNVETMEDLVKLVKQLDIAIEKPEDLRTLLTAVNASYDPDAARVRSGRVICVAVGCTAFGVAGLVSFLIIAASASTSTGWRGGPPYWLAGLGIIWGAALVATALTVLFSMLSVSVWNKRRPIPRPTPEPAPSGKEPPASANEIQNGIQAMRDVR